MNVLNFSRYNVRRHMGPALFKCVLVAVLGVSLQLILSASELIPLRSCTWLNRVNREICFHTTRLYFCQFGRPHWPWIKTDNFKLLMEPQQVTRYLYFRRRCYKTWGTSSSNCFMKWVSWAQPMLKLAVSTRTQVRKKQILIYKKHLPSVSLVGACDELKLEGINIKIAIIIIQKVKLKI